MKKLIIRLFLLLFIAAILYWTIPSTLAEFFPEQAFKFPIWLKDLIVEHNGPFLPIAFQIAYYLIALGLLIELFSANLTLRLNRDGFLAIIAIALFINGAIALTYGGIFKDFSQGIYDTIFYGLGLCILFLIQFDAASPGMKIVFWTRLVEVMGPIIGFTIIPAILGYYTAGAFVYYRQSAELLLAGTWFWNDFLVHSLSAMAVMYIIWKSSNRLFWIVTFSFAALIIGFILSGVLLDIFQSTAEGLR